MAQARPEAGEYFIEFRARHAVLGHSYIVYGRTGTAGEEIDVHYAGNQPLDDASAVIGAVFPVQGNIYGAKDDYALPPTTVYRRRLTATEYQHLKLTVARLRSRDHIWHLLFYNCNEFTLEIAHSIGMISLPFPWMPPDAMVTGLRLLNGP